MDVSGNRNFRQLPPSATGERRFAAHFSLPYWSHASASEKFFARRTEETPLQFSAMYFRRPQHDENGNWNCRWIDRCTITDSTGCRVVNDHYPARLQFNIPRLQHWMTEQQFMPLMKVSFRPAFADMADSPVITHVERLWDVLDLDTAINDNMLTDDRDEAEPDLHAVIEHTTGVVIPLGVGTRTEFIVGQNDMMTIRVRSTGSVDTPYHSLNGNEKYEDDAAAGSASGARSDSRSGKPYTEQELNRDIARWSRELGEHIAKRDTEEFAQWRAAIRELKEEALFEDRISQLERDQD